MDNPPIDYEFELPAPLRRAGVRGRLHRRGAAPAAGRKYTITRKPLAYVEHPENKLEYAAAVQTYHPGLTDDEAHTWLLDNTAYPFQTLQNIPEGHFHVRPALPIRDLAG